MSALRTTDAGRHQPRANRDRTADLHVLVAVRRKPEPVGRASLLPAQDRLVLLAALADLFGGFLPVESRWLGVCVRLRDDLRALGIRLARSSRSARPALDSRRQRLAPQQVRTRQLPAAHGHASGRGIAVPADLALSSEASRALGRWLIELYGEVER
jgi:hypothetical protein